MKLIIDIPEQMYQNAKAGVLCGNDILVKAIKNGILHETVTEFADRCRECGREKVLDKIREEIKSKKFGLTDTEDGRRIQSDIHAGFDGGIECALQIIDKYKAEGSEE